MTDIIQIAKAASFAAEAHTGQFRKYTGEPYIVHPLAVGKMIADFGGTPAMIMASYLHDTIEDVEHITNAVITLNFGDEVEEFVDGMTKRSYPKAKNRAERKEQERIRLSQTPGEVQSIKYADIIDNTKTIVQYDHKFGAVYLEEAIALLEVMTQGIPALRQLAIAQIEAEKFKLGVLTSGAAVV